MSVDTLMTGLPKGCISSVQLMRRTLVQIFLCVWRLIHAYFALTPLRSTTSPCVDMTEEPMHKVLRDLEVVAEREGCSA